MHSLDSLNLPMKITPDTSYHPQQNATNVTTNVTTSNDKMTNDKNYKTKSDFNELMVRSGESYKVVVDGPMICKTKIEMMDLFNKIHNFFIENKIYEMFELCGRSSYSDGVYYYKSKGVFKAHLLKFLGDRGYDGDKYLDDILFRATSRELDKID